PGKTDKELVNFIVRAVDFGMIETLGIRVKEGRVFSKDYGSEDTKLVFNEAAIKAMGLHDPVGKKVIMWQKDCSIIGVVKDFHVSSLHEAIAPMVFIYKPANTAMVMAKIEAGKERSTLERVENYYKAFNPGYLFEYKFLDEAYQAQYAAEKRVSLLSRYFAGLAILISCLGLFGLTTFNAEIRTKEIGIRKVLGASSNHVMLMLSKDFIKLVLIAIVIAFPLAWWAMNIWLSSFAYRVDVGPGVFILAGLAIIAVAIFTISYQALRTALMNPVKCLRTE
ncbi:MAG TPA: FtsX-like permease family protein, partial [Flavisolibacter sp.]|nr:FtsX-like permease family protein [Flavisolibacter sp.]